MNSQNYRVQYLIPTILVVGFIVYAIVKYSIHLCMDYLHLSDLPVSPFSTTITILALLYLLYDQILWSYPVLNFLVDSPDIRGRYQGTIRRRKAKGSPDVRTYEAVAEIEQSASSLKITFYTKSDDEEFSSVAEHVNIVSTDKFSIRLVYSYQLYEKGAFNPKQFGTNILQINRENSYITGSYYNTELNEGTIDLKFVSTKLSGKM